MPDRPWRFQRRMTDAEALMWNLEDDPHLRSTFLNITFLDRPPDVEAFRRRMSRVVTDIPRLRQRVLPAPGRLAPAEWSDDPCFDLDFHVRHLALPGPGTERQLLDLGARLAEDAFDRARPPWQFTIVEGLAGGRAALLAKMHHAITDGVGGVRLSAGFVDLTRDAIEPDTGEAPEWPFAGDGSGSASSALRAAAYTASRQAGLGLRAASGLAGLALHPSRLTGAVEVGRSLARQVAVTGSSMSPLWAGRRSLARHFEILSLDLDRVKRVAKVLGGTVNDAFVTGVAGGAGAYHRQRGADVADLRMSMPVSTRSDRSAGGNAFAPTRVLVPAGVADPVERFHLVRQRLEVTKQERSINLADTFAAVFNLLPTSLAVGIARQQIETVDFAASNVRGAPFDLYVAGARILANHPMGPTAGTAFNATVLSYLDRLDLGLAVDTAAVDDPALLLDCIEASFGELLAVG